MDDPCAIPVIIDNGSGTIKGGWAGDERPRANMPCFIGKPRYQYIFVGSGNQDRYVGHVAHHRRGVLNIKYPIEHGVIVNWDDMELIWHHTFYNELHLAPEEHSMLLTEPPLNPKKNREKMIEIIMEVFSCPSTYIAVQAAASLCATGRTKGIVLDSGDGVTQIAPVYEGHVLPHAVNRMDLGGRDLNYLARILTEAGCWLTTIAEHEIAREIKEKHCYVANDFELERHIASCSPNWSKKQYTMPDEQVVTIGSEQYRCPEVLFQPSFIGRESCGIHEMLHNSIMKSDIDLRTDLWNNIVLAEGTMKFPGIEQRLKKELVALAPYAKNINITAPEDREFLTWRGAGVLGTLALQQNKFITRDEYNEEGPTIVHKKCF